MLTRRKSPASVRDRIVMNTATRRNYSCNRTHRIRVRPHYIGAESAVCNPRKRRRYTMIAIRDRSMTIPGAVLFAGTLLFATASCAMDNDTMMHQSDSMSHDNGMMTHKDDMENDDAMMMQQDSMAAEHDAMMKKQGQGGD